LLYDERNPHFRPGGRVLKVYEEVKAALKNPYLLQKCTWQEIVKVMRKDPDLKKLTFMLQEKYGF